MEIVFLCHNCNIAFVENELLAMSHSNLIEKVVIYTEKPIRNQEISNSLKFEIVFYNLESVHINVLKSGILFFKESIINRKIYTSFSKLKSAYAVMRNELRKAMFIKNRGIKPQAVLFSYWAANEAFIVSYLKSLGLNNLAVTRLHAYDIYEEFDNKGRIPWRWFVLKYIDKFITISKHGEEYLNNKYREISGKVHTMYLGVFDIKKNTVNPVPKNAIRVVSCGWVDPHKNHMGIYNVLSKMNHIVWQHIGDGDALEAIKSLAEKEGKIKTEFSGAMSAKQIAELYKNHPFSCFISLSTTEGIPVSMMEAISHGIPVISTDVGGCSELVNNKTGVLLKTDYADTDVANAINYCVENFSNIEARNSIQNECNAKFDASKNYPLFFNFLKTENELFQNARLK